MFEDFRQKCLKFRRHAQKFDDIIVWDYYHVKLACEMPDSQTFRLGIDFGDPEQEGNGIWGEESDEEDKYFSSTWPPHVGVVNSLDLGKLTLQMAPLKRKGQEDEDFVDRDVKRRAPSSKANPKATPGQSRCPTLSLH